MICGIVCDLARVLDLTSDVPGWLDLPQWLQEDFSAINDSGFETLCQAFGRAARNSGISGLLVPSARVPEGVNLVVFRDRLRRAESIRVLGAYELKKYLA